MKEELLPTRIKERFGDKVRFEVSRPGRAWASVGLEDFLAVAKWLKEEAGYHHCSTISGLDRGDTLEALYHLSAGEGELTVRLAVPKTNPHTPTATGVWPGAGLYERELQDMLGFVVDGHPDPRRYVLPEDWPDGVYPLRKDYVYTYEETPPVTRK
mgnify:CR=1 FL=1